jgi:hypothetical protein
MKVCRGERSVRWLLVALALLTPLPIAHAADHLDGPRASAEPAADFGDVMAWMSPDAEKLYLLASVLRNATPDSRFSDAVQYVFHTASREAFGADAAAEVNVICIFDGTDQQTASCWAGAESFVTGDANSAGGIVSEDGRLRVETGLRNDAFFFNLDGFNATRALVSGAAEDLDFDAAGCPLLDEATADALVTQLQSAPGGGPAQDDFLGENILVIALAVDKAIVTPGGPIVSVWGSSNRR